MKRVITYGTYDLLHYGHINLLKRAKELGDYLIVGVTSDDFDKKRGKINVKQSLMERIENVRATGLADEIIVEEYEGQKIDDIRKYNVDIFTVGSDWEGKFDYLRDYCDVVYLQRTEGISSSDIRSNERSIRLGILGYNTLSIKLINESNYVNGLEISGIYDEKDFECNNLRRFDSYEDLMEASDAIYVASMPNNHFRDVKTALRNNKHVLCESPFSLKKEEAIELVELAKENNCILMDGIKTAYSTAFNRLLLLVKEGKIGDVYAVDATCTSLRKHTRDSWDSICYWGPVAFLPIFAILGCDYRSCQIISHLNDMNSDEFTRVNFIYNNATASATVASGVKSEGDLTISGTKGYIYVPSPWWKTDYFEIRYEDSQLNRRYFYQLDGEGIRYELVAFVKAIESGVNLSNINQDISLLITNILEEFYNSDTKFCI